MSIIFTLSDVWKWNTEQINSYLDFHDYKLIDQIPEVDKYIMVCELLAIQNNFTESDCNIVFSETFRNSFKSTYIYPNEERLFHGLVEMGLIDCRCKRNQMDNVSIIDPISHESISKENLYVMNGRCYNIQSLYQFFSSGSKHDPYDRKLIPTEIIDEVLDSQRVYGNLEVPINNLGFANLSLTSLLFQNRGLITNRTLRIYNFNVDNILKLSLSGNSIESIKGIIFPPNCTELDLSDNLITNCDEITFSDSLLDLNLENNCINSFQDTIFSPNLKTISLRGNQISSIPFLNDNCEVFDIGFNLLISIKNYTFPSKLNTLLLDNNLLTQISDLILPENLEIVDCSNNLIVKFERIVKNIRLISFWLVDNPILENRNGSEEYQIFRKSGINMVQEDRSSHLQL